MCGTGDINVQDFKAHAVIVGGSWHFREKVGRVTAAAALKGRPGFLSAAVLVSGR